MTDEKKRERKAFKVWVASWNWAEFNDMLLDETEEEFLNRGWAEYLRSTGEMPAEQTKPVSDDEIDAMATFHYPPNAYDAEIEGYRVGGKAVRDRCMAEPINDNGDIKNEQEAAEQREREAFEAGRKQNYWQRFIYFDFAEYLLHRTNKKSRKA